MKPRANRFTLPRALWICLAAVAISAPNHSYGTDVDTFDTIKVLETSIESIMDPECGGYCITGVCAHFYMGFSVDSGWWYYTVISPSIRHATPELLVSSYSHVGEEPYLEWRNTFGRAMDATNNSVGTTIGLPDGIQGGRPNPVQLDRHQGESFKEVDIIGHPLTQLPKMLRTNGSLRGSVSKPRQLPSRLNAPSRNGAEVIIPDPEASQSKSGFEGINVRELLDSDLISASGPIRQGVGVALTAVQVADLMDQIKTYAQFFQSVAQFFSVATTAAQIASTNWVTAFTNPRFRAPRLMCPTNTKALQPYYLSFADIFFWRAGYPVTDGPLSRADHSLQIVNPFSPDILPSTTSPFNLLGEMWGNKYPRDGFVNNTHDAEVASVTAWRAMDVLMTDVPRRARVGVGLPPTPRESFFSVGNPKWQMIHPEVKSCVTDPYYPANSLADGFIEPNQYGNYAWNYYRTYECCSHNGGQFLGRMVFPMPLCLTAPP